MRVNLNLVVVILVWSSLGTAQSIRFGAEWTLTNKSLIEAGRKGGNYAVVTKENANARDKLTKEILKKCPTCRLTATENRHVNDEPKYKITYPDMTWVEIDVDPWVIEINTHNTLDEYQDKRSNFELLFSVAAKVGLTPHQRIGGGHIHVDFDSAFNGDMLLARNFIVDMMNHPELAMGYFSKDYLNAPPLALLDSNQQELFLEILSAFDQKLITFDQFIDRINSEVYAKTFHKFQPVPANKYHAVNLTRARSDNLIRTIEVRAFRPPKSFAEYLLQMEIITARIAYLKVLGRPLKYEAIQIDPKTIGKKNLRQRFENYIHEMGFQINDVIQLLPEGLAKNYSAGRCAELFGRR